MKNFKELYKEFNNRFLKYFNTGLEFDEVINYSIEDGKRIRPVIFLMTYEMINKELDDKAYNFAIALELIHNYSLIHDDLPCMDDDDYRRERLTVHKKFGEDLGVLAGDSLLNKAYEIILSNSNSSSDVKAGLEIAKNAGIEGMIKGQILDIENKEENLSDVIETYKYKTSCLLVAAAKGGAILAGGNDEDEKKLENFALNLGLAYQLKDDLFDYEKDISIGKKTSLKYMSIEQCNEMIRDYTQKALNSIKDYKNNQNLINLSSALIEREK